MFVPWFIIKNKEHKSEQHKYVYIDNYIINKNEEKNKNKEEEKLIIIDLILNEE